MKNKKYCKHQTNNIPLLASENSNRKVWNIFLNTECHGWKPPQIFGGSWTGYLAVGPIFPQSLGGPYCLGDLHFHHGERGLTICMLSFKIENNSFLSWNSYVNTVSFVKFYMGNSLSPKLSEWRQGNFRFLDVYIWISSFMLFLSNILKYFF